MSGWTDALKQAHYDKLKYPPVSAEAPTAAKETWLCLWCSGAQDKTGVATSKGNCSACGAYGLLWDAAGHRTPTVAPAKAKGRKAPALKEAAIERQIVDLLECHGWYVLRTNKFATGGAVIVQGSIELGIPDLQARRAVVTGLEDPWRILNQIIWIEVKRPGGKVSVRQAAWHQLAQRRGETVLVAESVDQVAAAIGVKL